MPPKLLQSFTRDEAGVLVEYKVGDSVLIKPEPPAKQPFIGVIKEIHEKGVNQAGEPFQNMVVTWYYRPNEVVGGRKHFHGSMEVFESDHSDICDVSTIISHCEVLTLDDYLDAEEITAQTFFTRYFYSASKKEFKPDRVMVYCTCELPYNPDLPMVMCERCEEWYHLGCVGLEKADAHFICEQCGGAPHSKRAKLERQHSSKQSL